MDAAYCTNGSSKLVTRLRLLVHPLSRQEKKRSGNLHSSFAVIYEFSAELEWLGAEQCLTWLQVDIGV
jgi:hypothetical protein